MSNLKTQQGPVADVNSKTVLGNHKLCAQFLRDYVNIPGFEKITDEDIEDVTERFTSYFGVEYNADTVKKVHLNQEGQDVEAYVISLIDHKSQVDYNVTIQLLRYMVCIWTEYEKKLLNDGERKGITSNKNFKYPPIVPIVYYEGAEPWTADLHLKDRIMMNDIFGKYIPDYEYLVIRNHDYTNEELLAHQDEMSLIMLINKIQRKEDLTEYLKLPKEDIESIVKESPKEVLNIIATMIQTLCERVNATETEKEECVRKVVSRQMGYFFENMQTWDVQADRKEVQIEREQLKEDQQKFQEDQEKFREEKQKFSEDQQKFSEDQQKFSEEKQKFLEEKQRVKEESTRVQEESARAKEELDDLQLERDVLRLALQGKGEKEIAGLVHCSYEKVREILG